MHVNEEWMKCTRLKYQSNAIVFDHPILKSIYYGVPFLRYIDFFLYHVWQTVNVNAL